MITYLSFNSLKISIEPSVFPMYSMGLVDMSQHSVPDQSLVAHALANIASQPTSNVEELCIKHGSAFVNEYCRRDPITGERCDGGPSNPNHLLGCFPCLFPYGAGGFEVDREVDIPYEAHIRWALRYEDRRFRLDPWFMFVAFQVSIKRAVCRAAMLQMHRELFNRHLNAFSHLKESDFLKASREEGAGKPISHPDIRAIRQLVSTVQMEIPGTDEAKMSLRGMIWGTVASMNPPNIWLTINPSDIHNPIAQFFAGASIDLDDFHPGMSPTVTERAIRIAQDPYAAALFFHVFIERMLEDVFGIKGAQGSSYIRRTPGVLGPVNAYVGAVEAQGRGTLHLHALLWLYHSPSVSQIREMLHDPMFRCRVTEWLRQNIHADIGGLRFDQFMTIENDPSVAFSRPLHPDDPHRTEKERLLARNLQVHVCSINSCLLKKNGRWTCKRGFPFTCSTDPWVEEDGQCGPSRISDQLNAWCESVLQLGLCNNDMKLILNGPETAPLSWYLSTYTSKKRHNTSNASAIFAQRFAYQQPSQDPPTTVEELRDSHRRMIVRFVNALNRNQELGAPEIVSYIMGWNDRFLSHHFVRIYWNTAMAALTITYPELISSM